MEVKHGFLSVSRSVILVLKYLLIGVIWIVKMMIKYLIWILTILMKFGRIMLTGIRYIV